MRTLLKTVLLALLFSSCRTSAPDAGLAGGNDNRPDFPESIPDNSIPKPEKLDKAYFRASYQHLSEDDFDAKWQASLASPLLFFRSYVNTWYNEVNDIPGQGKVGPCFGDPHPENFGWIWFGNDDFRYLYNDMDDSGTCPVGFDALRYFTAMKLYWQDDEYEKKVRDEYVAAMQDKTKKDPDAIKEFKPKLAKLYAKIEEKSLDGDKIKLTETVVAIDEALKGKIYRAVEVGLALQDESLNFLDAAKVIVKSGGSGGLDRYYVLLKDGQGQKQLLEVKELAKAATELGDWRSKKFMPRWLMMYQAWEDETPRFFAFMKLGSSDYIVRSRVKNSIDLIDLNREEKLKLFKYQVNLMATLHQVTIKDVSKFGNWLEKESKFMAERYRAAYKLAKETPAIKK